MGINVLNKKCWVVYAVQHYVTEGKYYIAAMKKGAKSFYNIGKAFSWTDYIIDLDGLGYISEDYTRAQLFTKKEAELFIKEAVNRHKTTFFKGSVKDLKEGTTYTDRYGLHMEKLSKEDLKLMVLKNIL